MEFKQFTMKVAMRSAFLVASMVVLLFAFINDGYHGLSILMILLLVVQGVGFFNYVAKTNSELVRFLEAAKYADFSQRFELKELGTGFDELGDTFATILAKLQTVRQSQEQELKHLKAMVEHVPVPLLSLHSDKSITLWNNSAKRFFGNHLIRDIDDIRTLDHGFAQQLTAITPGQRPLFTIEMDQMPYQITLSATQLLIAGQKEMLISLQNIKSELDKAQLEAWQALVRVLTHEIMNSITPVASLAKTAATLIDDARGEQDKIDSESLEDAHDAVATVARRSEALMEFVGNYRRLTSLPEPNLSKVMVADLIGQVLDLFAAEHKDKSNKIEVNVQPASLPQELDEQMLEQSLINMLINAHQATLNQLEPVIKINAFLNTRGHTVLEIEDNGEGIDNDIAEKVFVPFFTTKKEGSGVGLALTRQVMIAHNGSVKLESSELGGAKFVLTF